MRLGRLIRLGTALVFASAFAVLTLFSGALYTYSVLTDEALVAELRFTQIGPQHYEAQLATDNGCTQRSFELYGDQWRLDASFLKWHAWATLLGLDAYYRLSRIEGRYVNVVEQNQRPNVAYALADEQAFNIVDLAAGMGRWNIFVDATYGSSTFQNVDTDAVHQVFRTQTGLITRSAELPAAAPREGALQVDVLNACGAEPGIWRRFTTWADRSAGRLAGRQATS